MKASKTYKRDFIATLSERFSEKAPLMQFLIGPRQVGKTTGVEQFLKSYQGPYIYEIVEKDFNPNSSWLRLQWQKALALGECTLLVIDEVQKIENWSETLKSLWDTSLKKKGNIKCLFLGSSSLNLQKGLTESLAGRYELIPVFHWNYLESTKLKSQLSIDQFCELGGYPKSYSLLKDKTRFNSYIRDSIVKNVIEKDILLNHTVKKPALFKQTAEVISAYPAMEISYTKILGQLQEGGNVELVKYYLTLYEGAFLFKGIPKYSGPKSKLTSPKILVMAPALTHVLCPVEIDHGHLFENVVGIELLKYSDDLFYWREGDYEIDFIARINKKYYAIEVKSGRKKHSKSLDVFTKKFPLIKILVIDHGEYKRLCKEKEEFFK